MAERTGRSSTTITVFASAPGISRTCGPTPKTPTRSTSQTPACSVPSMAAKHSNVFNAPHGDHHGLWIDPNNPNRMINGNDGGATISVDGGKNWSTQNNQPTAQFYHVVADNDFPYHVYGSQQDNSTVGIATAQRSRLYRSPGLGSRRRRRERLHRRRSARFQYRLCRLVFRPIITRFDRRTNQAQNIQQWPDRSRRLQRRRSQKYRYTWTMPIIISSARSQCDLSRLAIRCFVQTMAATPGDHQPRSHAATINPSSRIPAAPSPKIRPASSFTT